MQEGSTNDDRLNGAGDISSFGPTVRNKRHAGVTCWSDMLELKTVLGGIVWEVTRVGLRPTLSL